MSGKKLPRHNLGELLLSSGHITALELSEALAIKSSGDSRRLGEILVSIGHLSERDLAHLLRIQNAKRGTLESEDGVQLVSNAVEQQKATIESIDQVMEAAEELTKLVKE